MIELFTDKNKVNQILSMVGNIKIMGASGDAMIVFSIWVTVDAGRNLKIRAKMRPNFQRFWNSSLQ